MIAGIPIVDINYWNSIMKAVDTDSSLPDINLFTIFLQDKGLQRLSLKPNLKRKSLFHEKKFIFFSDSSYQKYKKIIKDAGKHCDFLTTTVINFYEFEKIF